MEAPCRVPAPWKPNAESQPHGSLVQNPGPVEAQYRVPAP
ncbi:hypothetical protein chiPu_0027588, partial [Chiloscyllium punctatum]|nr:hypothetical protein [Chiloscyllium punctatum]